MAKFEDTQLPDVGSKWVCTVNYPLAASITEGDVIEVVELEEYLVVYKDTYGKSWLASYNDFPYLFKPYEEPQKEKTPTELTAGAALSGDQVNSPSHYGQGSIEAINYIEDFLTREEYIGYLRGNIAKYLHRFRHKGKAYEDLKKADWYKNRLNKLFEGE